MKKILTLLLIVLLAGGGSAYALNVPSVISDNMVLQRNSTVRIWGTAEAGEKIIVTASWAAEKYSVEADVTGSWIVEIPTSEAAEKQTLKIDGASESLRLKNIMIGEVWICSGQSNMKFMVEQSIDVIASLKSPNPNIRLYNTGQRSSRIPMDDIPINGWTTSAPAHLGSFSAVGYAFADMLQKELGVPVGMINASYGGTSIESWMPEEEITGNELFNYGLNKSLEDKAKKWKGKDRYFAGAQYNANIHPIVNTTVAGVIWYQGCHNVVTTASHYDLLLDRFVASWRERFRNPELPFYIVQIAPHIYEGVNGAILREKQAVAVARQEHVEMIPSIDQNERTGDIHPRNKLVIGERLAAAALGEHYGRDIDYRAPQYAGHVTEGNKIRVKLSDAQKGLKYIGNSIVGFQVSDQDGSYFLAQAAIDGSDILVWSDNVEEPYGVRYCFDESVGNVFCNNGLPLHPFRTDFDNHAPYERGMYESIESGKITVRYSGGREGIVTDNFKPWSNKDIVAKDVIPSLVGMSMLNPEWLEAGSTMPSLGITSHYDGYLYILVRDVHYVLKQKGWEIVPCSLMPLYDLEKKNRRRGNLYLARREVKKGETVSLTSSETNVCGVIPIAENIKPK